MGGEEGGGACECGRELCSLGGWLAGEYEAEAEAELTRWGARAIRERSCGPLERPGLC